MAPLREDDPVSAGPAERPLLHDATFAEIVAGIDEPGERET